MVYCLQGVAFDYSTFTRLRNQDCNSESLQKRCERQERYPEETGIVEKRSLPWQSSSTFSITTLGHESRTRQPERRQIVV
jgi:hypothetical protein